MQKVIVDTNAYISSMIMVLLSCAARDFLIPLFVWKNHLKNKSYAYRFWFCVITQASLQINLVLLLGFLDICSRGTVIGCNIVIYLLILWNFSDKKLFRRLKGWSDAFWEAYRNDRLVSYLLREAAGWWKTFIRTAGGWRIWRYMRTHWLEILLMAGLIVYNIWFLTYNVMRYHCYQFSDIPVHQSWIYELEQGNLFSDGIYPFGMHAMTYIIRVLFGLNLREILLYAGAYQTVLLFIGLFILAKEIFYGKYTPVTVVVIISLMLNQGRYAASLPQEAGMYAVVGIAYFMIRYLHGDRKKFVIEGDSRFRRVFRAGCYINRRYIRSEEILLMLCIGLVIAYHFYTAIAAIFLVAAIGIAYIPKIFKKQYFIPLLFCGIMGAFIAVLPMGACLAKGIPFQESMAWATSVMTGEEWVGSDPDYQSELAQALDRGDIGGSLDADQEAEEETQKVEVDYSSMTPIEILRFYSNALINFGILAMFGYAAIRLMFLCMLSGAVCAVLFMLRKKTRCYGHDYMAMIINMIILCTMGAAQQLGLMELIAAARASTFAEPFIGFIYMLPVDFAFRVLGGWKNKYYQAVLNVISAAVCIGTTYMIITLGWYHSFFEINQAYYNESEYLLRNIKKSYEKNTFTIVSPTDEYYDVLDYGRHTQLSEFINMVNGKQEAFTFPTEYVFFFIEKKVLQDYFYGPVNVDLKYAAMDFVYFANTQDYYFERATIESQAYYWALKFKQIYPRNFKVYYEDDIYVAYIMKQNPYSPYDLQVDYLSDYTDEIETNGW
ncbi:hypothetical protein [Kineothrix alysoides]|uniref:hypothetical protein n=1 Tax=Kineothrix alysoides TaxID=1469948 RepID=UPI0004DB7B7A|nr:hypothetical protein [Kineothrix alysoides]